MRETPGRRRPPIRQQRLTEQICAELERMILEGGLSPGGKIPSERDLAVQFGVSRATVAKAIGQLEMKGVLHSHQGGGTFVSPSSDRAFRNLFGSIVLLNKGTLRELIEVRSILEREIVRLAVERASEEDVGTLRKYTAVMRSAIHDATRFVEADLAFHMKLAEAADNGLLCELIRPIQNIIRQQMQLGTLLPGAMQRAVRWREEIVGALAARSTAGALDALTQHLDETRSEVDQTPDESITPPATGK